MKLLRLLLLPIKLILLPFKMLKVLIGLLVVLVLLVVGLYFAMPHLAKIGIEKGCEHMLGVPTTVESVKLKLFAGQFEMNKLVIANPPNFGPEPFVKVDQLRVYMVPKSVLTDTVQLDLFELDGLDIRIEQHVDGSNTKPILDHLEEQTPESKPSEGGGRRFKIDRIVIRNVRAHVDVLSELTEREPVTITIPEIIITDLDSDNAEGLMMDELIQRILPAVLGQVLRQGGDMLPPEYRDELEDQLGSLTEQINEHLPEGALDTAGDILQDLLKPRD